MTVTNTGISSGPFYPNGSTTTFPFTFKAASADEVVVVDGAGLAISPSLYRVTLSTGSDGGSVIFYSAPTANAEPSLGIRSAPDFTQEIDFTNQGSFLPEQHNEANDRAAIRDLILRDLVSSASGLAQAALDRTIPTSLPAVVSSLASLASLTSVPIAGQQAWLFAGGRTGLWQWQTGDYAARVAADPLHGLYQPHATIADTAGCWVRFWDGIAAQPEWFGAVVGGPDCYAALQACMNLCPVTHLGAGDYWLSDTPRVPPYRTLEGVGSYRSMGGTGTRLVINSATKDVLAVGLAAFPTGGVNNFAKNSIVRGLSLGRSTPVTPPASGTPQFGAAGLRMTFALQCTIEDVYADDHTIGFYLNGVVHSFVNACLAFRQTAGTSATNDFFRGFWCDGGGSYGTAGGNASIYLTDCNTTVGGSPTLTEATGFLLSNAFVDTFLIRPETATLKTGIIIDGNSLTSPGQHIDVHIDRPTLDACSANGIVVTNTNAYAAIEISNPYVAVLPGASAAISLGGSTTSASGVSILGGQVFGILDAAGGGTAIGLYMENASKIVVEKLRAEGCARPFGIANCTDFSIDGIANNPNETANPYQAAFFVTGSSVGTIKAAVTGKSNAFPQGVLLNGTGNSRLSIDPTGVNPACIQGGAANKLVINATQITAGGNYTGAGASSSSGTIAVSGVVN